MRRALPCLTALWQISRKGCNSLCHLGEGGEKVKTRYGAGGEEGGVTREGTHDALAADI